MSQDSSLELKKKFRKVFPEHAKLLDLAKSQDQIDELHSRFVDEAKQKTIEYVKNSDLSDEDKQKVMTTMKDLKATPKGVIAVDSLLLSQEKFASLIAAKDTEIKNEIHVLLDTLQRFEKGRFNDPEKDKSLKDKASLAAGLVSGGIACIGGVALALLRKRAARAMVRMIQQNLETAPSLTVHIGDDPSINVQRGPLDIEDVGPLGFEDVESFTDLLEAFWSSPGFMALLATVAVLSLVIPIVFFTEKPSNCIIFLINELDKPLEFSEEYNIHGKPHTITTVIPELTTLGDEKFASGGFMVSVKDKSAMVGTQYGFTMKYGDTLLSFGVHNPLTGDNSCYCEVNTSAKSVAEKSNSLPHQYSDSVQDDVIISIRNSSKDGFTAYYIARATLKAK